MNRQTFEVYVETQLAPTLQPGDVVILDNLSSHKSEMAFAKLKAHLRRIGARTTNALWKAVGNICDLYTPDECWNYLKEAGYVSD